MKPFVGISLYKPRSGEKLIFIVIYCNLVYYYVQPNTYNF